MAVNRAPAAKRPEHPAASLPARDDALASSVNAVAAPTPAPTKDEGERFTEQLNVRLRPSTITRLGAALDHLPRSQNKQSVVDAAINEYIDRLNLN